ARTIVDREVTLRGATVEGSFDASGGRTGGIVMPGAEVHRDIEISHEVIQSLEMTTALVNGSVKLDDVLIVNSLTAHEAKIGRAMTFDTVRIAGGMDLNDLAPTGGLSAVNLTVEGSLMLSISG